MTVATEQRIHLSESLQRLIDSRLDTIERVLLGRVARSERRAIVREVELQIHELLGERETDEPSREDVLSVLARLDPPEAYLPEESRTDSPSPNSGPIRPVVRSVRHGDFRVGKASAILGLSAVSTAFLLLPLAYLISSSLGSVELALFFCGGALLIMLVSGVLGITLGFYARKSGPWALVGIVTSILAVLFALLLSAVLVLQL